MREATCKKALWSPGPSSLLPVVYIASPIQHTWNHYHYAFAETAWYMQTSNILSELLSGDAMVMSKAAEVPQS